MATTDLIKTVYLALFSAEMRRLNSTIVKLNKDNKRLRGVRVDGFTYNGEFFLPQSGDLSVLGAGQSRIPLHHDLYAEMETYLKDREIIANDGMFVKQCLFNLLQPCTDAQQIRDTLPEFIVQLLPELAAIPRGDDPAFTIRDNPRAIRQYEKILPTMELYSAARFLY